MPSSLFSLYIFTLCDVFRYLLDVKWFKQWKKYVGFESQDQQEMGLETAHPGPVDTSCLFKGCYDYVDFRNSSSRESFYLTHKFFCLISFVE